MRLAQVSAIVPPNDGGYLQENTRRVVEIMLASHPLMQYLEFYTHIGNADTPRSRGTSSGGAFRAKGSDYSASDVTPQFGATALKIFGDAFTVDQADIRRSIDIDGYISDELAVYAEEQTYNFTEQLVHGAGTGNAFTGIAGLCDSEQKVALATNGDTVPLGNSDANRTKQQAFFEKLDKAINKTRGGARIIMMNSDLLSRITNIYREAFRWIAGVGENIPTYKGIPVIPMGYDADGNEILPFNETQGSSTTCSSIYIVSPGQKTKFTIATNTGVNVYLSKENEKRRVTVEGDFDPNKLDAKAISAVTGIKLA